MTFKKDYINYLLHTVVNSPAGGFKDNYRMSKLVDTISSIDDVMKITYLAGKTAGLESLFKYLLYVSDKIDKSQVTIFNLKDNFDYDIKNLEKICEKISQYKSENVHEVLENITDEINSSEPSIKPEEIIHINIGDEGDPINIKEAVWETDEISQEEDTGDTKLTLIENTESYSGDAEVFELESITDSVENSDEIQTDEVQTDLMEIESGDIDKKGTQEEESDELKDSFGIEKEGLNTNETDTGKSRDDIKDEQEDTEAHEEEIIGIESEAEIVSEGENKAEELSEEQLPEIELEIEVHKPVSSSASEELVKEESITSEAYYKFETKFFEEVKILEKLLVSVGKDCRSDESEKLSEKCLQCLTEIIEITSELSSLSRQLSFDLIADIFLTMNLYFTKTISQPELLTGERIKLFDSSLALVNSLIKGEDYLNYDTIVDKIEKLKDDISSESENKYQKVEINDTSEGKIADADTDITAQDTIADEQAEFIPKPNVPQSKMDSAVFKLKYLVKEFEKSFLSIDELNSEYSKFDAIEKISELNNSLRLIAKVSAIVRLNDVLKLAEVTYVFLKYVKDYRMDLMEPEIKQIIKYIIFTFKMLLTNRKPEDFNVLVKHLNNPVKIFADS